MKRTIFLTALVTNALTSLPVLAHETHAGQEASLGHYLSTPAHLVPITLVVGTTLYMILKILSYKKS